MTKEQALELLRRASANETLTPAERSKLLEALRIVANGIFN